MKLNRFLMVLTVAALSVTTLSSCGGGDDDGAAKETGVVVASSERTAPAVNEVVEAFKRANPDVDVTVSAQEYDALMAGIKNKTAGVTIVPKLWLQPPPTGVTTGSFGRTMTVIAVPSANPKNITSTAAFRPGSGLKTRVCGPNSQFGNFGIIALGQSRVVPDPATVGVDCDAEALQQVANGTLDAAFFFRDAAQVPAGVELVDIPPAENLIFDHSFVVSGATPDDRAFGTFLTSPEVRQILTQNGLLP